MSSTFTVQVVRDTATPALKGFEARARNPIPGLNIAARALGNLLKTHFRAKAQTANKLGGDRTFFWLAVAQGVNAPQQTGPSSVAISVSHPAINQKIFGGTIRPKRASALTVPVHRLAHGRSARVLAAYLGVVLFRLGNVLAAWDPASVKKGRSKQAKAVGETRASQAGARKLTIYYVLMKSVTQKADPTALPPRSEMERVVTENFNRWLIGPAQQAAT